MTAEVAGALAQRPAAEPGLGLALRLARRELRGGLSGFRVFLACLMLGVAAIAGIGSLSSAMLSGIAGNARAILGGAVELRLIYRSAAEEELTWLKANSSRFSETVELRAMARAPAGRRAGEGARRLVELKAVDGAYPLYGSLASAPEMPAERALGLADGRWGALVEPGLLQRLGLALGDSLVIGDLAYEVRGRLVFEPDRATRVFTLGPRVLVARESLRQTGLERPGSLTYHHYRLDPPEGESLESWRERLAAALPKAGWRVQDIRSANPGLSRFVEQVTLFMSLVGLTALLVGGVGVANAVGSYLDGRRRTIATLKCLGAPARLIFQVYLLQVLLLALLGIGLGLLLGAAVPWLVAPLLERQLNFPLETGLYASALARAALFGLLTALSFALWPLARAQLVPAASLFRETVERQRRLPPLWALLAIGLAALALATAAVLGSHDRLFALGFVAGSIGALLLFRLAAAGVMELARRLPRPRRPVPRLALANLHRPGAPTASVVLSLGLGATVLVAIALIAGNLREQVAEKIPAEAPGFFFIDIQPEEAARFEEIVTATPGVTRTSQVPMLRGRIVALDGVPVEKLEVPGDIAWVFRGDRGITWSPEPPENGELVAGSWWPEDYAGPQLVSLDAEVAGKMGVGLGDSVTVNVLGRELVAEIANLRRIDWESLGINFVMVFSPGVLAAAPQTRLATVYLDPQQEALLEQRVTDALPNVSAVRVKDALARVEEMLQNIVVAVTSTAGVTVLAGLLVLSGAVAAGHRRRIYDSVVLKVLGATRGDVARAFLLEYGLMGLATAVIAVFVGTLAAWVVVRLVLELGSFTFLPFQVAGTAAAAVLVTLLFGFAGTWRALAAKAAPLLRNE